MDPTRAETREERMQQRLRGAQRRDVKDVDFGLTFPSAPVEPQQVVSREPLLPEPPVQLSSRTPGSVRGRGRPKAIPVEEKTRPVTQSVNDANTSAKRRKLSVEEPLDPPSSTRSTRSSLRAPRPDIYALPEEESNEVPSPENADISTNQAVEHDVAEEVETRAPILQSRNPKTRSPQGLEQDNGAQIKNGLVSDAPTVHESLDEAAQRSTELLNGNHDKIAMDVEELPAVNPSEMQRKRKRGEVAQANPPPMKRIAVHSPRIVRRHQRRKSATNKSLGVEEDAEDHSSDEAEEVTDQEAAAVLYKNRNRRVLNDAIDKPVHESPIVRQKKHIKQPQPSIPKPESRKSQKPISKTNKVPRRSKKLSKPKERLGSTIPVTVHRMTERLYYEDNETDAEILNSEIPHLKKGGVNAIDVLSQICEETIKSSLDMLHELIVNADDSASKREYKTKLRAVENFGSELQTRLIEHTINLDNTFALERRVRDEQKRKLALREDILRIRAEREQVALRMDDIRIKHEAETQVARKRDALNITIHDIEMAIELGKANVNANGHLQMRGIELVLKRVASEVSNKSNSGGMLKQVKDFNAFLERTALALETRNT